MNENEFKCQCTECQMEFVKIKQMIEEIKKDKLDSNIWKNDISSIEKEIYQLSSKFDNLSHTVSQHDDILSKMKESIEIIKEKILNLDENQVISNAEVKMELNDLKNELNKISNILEIFQEKYIDKFDDIEKLIQIKIYESNKDKSDKQDKSTWQSTLVEKFNIGKKFSTFLKVSIGILVVGIILAFFIAIGVSIFHVSDILNYFMNK